MKTGDCVQLKSGGCLMTVTAVHRGESYHNVDCVWFNDAGELKRGGFPVSSLNQWVLTEQEGTR